MAGYTRQSTFADGDTITSALFNNEYNQLLNAFGNTSGHKHDGTANEGPVIGLIGDAGVVTPLNKVLIDSTNDHIEFWVDVSSSSVQQLYIADGAIVPVTDNDIDLGTSSLQFKDLYINGTANIDSLVLATGSTVTAVLDEDNLSSNSATSLVTQQSVKAYIDAQVTAQDLDFAGDSGGALSIDLDSESLTIAGGTGLATVGSGNTITVNIDSTVTTLTGSQTLTNKTLTSPDINTPDIDGGTIDGTVIGGSSAAAITGTAITGTSFVIGSANITEAELEILDGATVTTAELNILDGVTASAADINLIDGITNGTVIASKAIITDANKDITGGRNITISGELDAATLDISGNADIDGTLEADAITIAGVTLAETISDTVGAMVGSNTETGIAVTYEDSDNTLDFVLATAQPTITSLGTLTTLTVDDITINGSTISDSGDLTIDVGGDLSLDADGGNIILKDGGTSFGKLVQNSSNFHIVAAVQDKDIKFFGNDGGSSVTALTLDMSDAGAATFNAGASFGSGIDVTGTVTADGLTVDGEGRIEETGAAARFVVSRTDALNTSATASVDLLEGSAGGSFGSANNYGFSIDLDGSNNTLNVLSGNQTTVTKRLSVARDTGDIAFYDDTGSSQALFWDAGAESLGIGTTSPDGNLEVVASSVIDSTSDTVNAVLMGLSGTNRTTIQLDTADTTHTNRQWGLTNIAGDFYIGRHGLSVMTLKNDGNVGIGTTSPSSKFSVSNAGAGGLEISPSYSGTRNLVINYNRSTSAYTGVDFDATDYIFYGSGSEKMRIDSSGNLLVGKTTSSFNAAGAEIRPSGVVIGTVDGAAGLIANRLTSDGTLIQLSKDGSTVGSIGTYNSATAILSGSAGSYSGLYLNTNKIEPVGNNFGSEIRANNTIDIGSSTYKFKDLHLSGTGYFGTSVGIGTSSPNESLHVHKSTTPRILLTDATTGTTSGSDGMFLGIAGDQGLNIWNYENTYTRFAVNNSEKMRIDSSGNVGIGRTSASSRLHVQGPTDTSTISTSSTPAARINNGGAISLWIGSNAYNYGYVQSIQDDGTNNLKPLSLQPLGGNVGIGTSSPSTALEIVDSTANAVLRLTRNDTVITAGNHIGAIEFAGADTNDAGVSAKIIAEAESGAGQTALAMYTGTPSALSERLRIDKDGLVGIGTTNPDSNLHISSAGGTELHLQEETAGQSAQIKFTNPQNSFVAGSDANPQIFFINTDGNQGSGLCIDTSNNVGIGTSSVDRELHLKAANPRFRIEDSDGGYSEISGNGGHLTLQADAGNTQSGSRIVYEIDADEKMRLDSSGNVGIGGTSGSRRLNVFSDTDRYTMDLRNESGFNSEELSGIVFSGKYDSSNNVTDMASIGGGKENTTDGNFGGRLSFFTRPHNGSDTERMRIDSSGRVGIGETSPQNPLHVRSDSASGENYAIQIDNNNTTVGSQIGMLFRSRVGGTNTDFSIRGIANGTDDMDLTFNSDGGTEAMRIDSSGNLLVGTTTLADVNNIITNHLLEGASSTAGAGAVGVYNNTGTANCPALNVLNLDTSTDTSNRFVQFYANVTSSGATAMGGIVGNGASNVQFAALSDAREKENITSITGSLDKITSLNPVEFDWIASGEHCNAGFVAQEVETIFPEFIVDNISSEGEEERKGLTGGMTGGIVAHLVKAIQEQQTQIDALQSEINLLKGE